MVSNEMVIVDSEKIEWESIEELSEGRICASGVQVKVLNRDEETGAMVLLAKWERGFHEAKHIHLSDNDFIVLKGKLVDEKGNEIKKGMCFFSKAGVEHGPFDAPEGCILFVHFKGPAW